MTNFHTLSDGLKIYERIWSPATPPKAHLVLLHGFSDRVDHYDAFFKVLLATYPIRVTGWDRRGWGRTVHSPSERGNTGTKDKQIADLNEYLNHVISTIPDLSSTPLFLMGHSMGGQELAYYMLNSYEIPNDARPSVSGIIFNGPYIGLDAATEPSAVKVGVGRLAARFMPHFQLSNPVRVEYISPDKAVQKMYKDDPLCHNLGTLECFRDMLERSKELQDLARDPKTPPETLKNRLPCPTLWTHGTADKACDSVVSAKLCEGLEACGNREGDKVLKLYEGWLHQLHNEPNGCKEQYAKDVGEWILSIVARERS